MGDIIKPGFLLSMWLGESGLWCVMPNSGSDGDVGLDFFTVGW